MMTFNAASLIIISYILFNPVSLAVEIGGNWSGKGEGIFSSCIDPTNNATLATQLLFELDPPPAQFPDKFEVDYVGTDSSGTTNLAGIGFSNDATHISGQLIGIHSNTASGSVTYDFQGIFLSEDILQIKGSGVNLNCQYSLQGLVERDFSIIGHIPEVEGLAPELVDSIEIINDDITFTRTTSQTKNTINNHLRHLLSGTTNNQISQNTFLLQSGLAAGDAFANHLGIWVSYDRSEFKNSFVKTKYNGFVNNALVGVDYLLMDQMIIGFALGYEKTKVNTIFNNGKVNATGISFNPYFGFLLNDTWGINLNAGYTKMDYKQFRTFATTRVNSDTKGRRWFINTSINGTWELNRFIITSNVGALKAGNKDDSHTNSLGIFVTETRAQMSTLSLGGEIAYAFNTIEPYLNLNFNHNTHSAVSHLAGSLQPQDDRNDLMAGLGFRYYGSQGLSISTELSKRFRRENLSENHFSIMARWDF